MPKSVSLEVPIDEVPDVAALKAKLADAQAELKAAEAELDHLSSILNPLPWSTTNTPTITELDAVRARQQEPFVRERVLLA